MSRKKSRRAFLAGGAFAVASVSVGAIGCGPKKSDQEGDKAPDTPEEQQKKMEEMKELAPK